MNMHPIKIRKTACPRLLENWANTQFAETLTSIDIGKANTLAAITFSCNNTVEKGQDSTYTAVLDVITVMNLRFITLHDSSTLTLARSYSYGLDM